MFYDIRKKRHRKPAKPRHSDTIRICVTGGPCGGKSEGINMLFDKLKGITVPVFIVP
jgi:predicted GTPase